MKLHAKDAQREDPELEKPLTSEQPEPEETEYSLEEIMREFGGWSKPTIEVSEPEEPEPDEPAISEDTPPEQPEEEEEQANAPEEVPQEPESNTEPEEPAPKHQFVFIDAGTGAPAPTETTESKVWTYEPPKAAQEETPVQETTVETGGEETKERKKKQRVKREPQTKAPKKVQKEPPQQPTMSPEEAYRHYAAVAGSARARCVFQLLLFLFAVYFALAERFVVLMLPFFSGFSVRFFLMGGLMAAGILLALPSLVRGCGLLRQKRVTPDTYVLFLLLAVCGYGIVAYPAHQIPPFIVVQFAALLATWAEMNRCIGCYHALKAIGTRANVGQVRVLEQGWEGKRCIYLANGQEADLVSSLETESGAGKVLSGYCAAALLISIVFAAVTYFAAGQNFLWSLSVLLCGAFPVASLYCCDRPFASISRRLQHGGAALCGWRGASALSGEAGMVIRDREIFPRGAVTLNGLKVYNDFRVDQMISYTATAISSCESALMPLFETLMQEQGGHLMQVENFRTYEGGGVGVEIHGDVVLVGSLSFMRLMGIEMPAGTNLKQAVYTSVNGRLAGVIAVNYTPAVSVTAALQAIVRSQRLDPIFALTDFVVSPAMLHHKFKIPSERLEFPTMAERMRLVEMESDGETDACGALLTRTTFAAYTDTVLGARSLISVARIGTAVCLVCGILGLALMAFLTYVGATTVATTTNLLLFSLIWTIPSLLVTSWIGRY
jgi:hypothetical protein